MLIKKGTKLKVNHNRKGKFIGVASKDFDTNDESYPLIVADGQKPVMGIVTIWLSGEKIPCQKYLSHITPL